MVLKDKNSKYALKASVTYSKGKVKGEMAHRTEVGERNKPTLEEIDELEYRLKYGSRREDKPLI